MNEEEYIEELEKIAMKTYGNHYMDLCFSRQRNVQTLFKAGGI